MNPSSHKARRRVRVSETPDQVPEPAPQSWLKRYRVWLNTAGDLFEERKIVFAALLLLIWLIASICIFLILDILRFLYYALKLIW